MGRPPPGYEFIEPAAPEPAARPPAGYEVGRPPEGYELVGPAGPLAPPGAPGARKETPLEAARRAKVTSTVLGQAQTYRLLGQNLSDAYRARFGEAPFAGQAETEAAQRNLEQAQHDLATIASGERRPLPGETPVIGEGTGLQRLGNAVSAFFVPQRQAVKALAGQQTWRDVLEQSWEQIKHPSTRETMGDVAEQIASAHAKPGPFSAGDYANEEARKTRDEWRAAYGEPRNSVQQDQEERAVQKSYQEALSRASRDPTVLQGRPPVERFAGIRPRTAAVLGEVAELAVPSPGMAALGLAAKGVGKGVGLAVKTGIRGLEKVSPMTQRFMDQWYFGGPLRRTEASLAGMPEQVQKEWSSVRDELLERNVAAENQARQTLGGLKEAFQGMTPSEGTLVRDAIEHPELLSGNPRLLEPLAQRGVNVVPFLNPKASGFSGFPWIRRQIEQQAAAFTPAGEATKSYAVGLGLGGVGAKWGPHVVPPDVVYQGWLRTLGAKAPDIKRLWPARQKFMEIGKDVRQRLLAADPLARNIEEPYLGHFADPAAELAMRKRGIPVAALSDVEREGMVLKSQHLQPISSPYQVRSEFGRHLAEDLNRELAQPWEGFTGQEILPQLDTRLALNATMAAKYPGAFTTRPPVPWPETGYRGAWDDVLLGGRDFFTGALEPQARKLLRDIENANTLELLQKWKGRGIDVTGREAEAMSAAPGGLGNWQVPRSAAWRRVSEEKNIAVPRPVAEAIEGTRVLGGGKSGFYDTLVDIGMGRRLPGTGLNLLSELFKIPATIMNPRYYFRNWGGNLGQLYKEFGREGGVPFTPSWLERRGLAKDVQEALRLEATDPERAKLLARGVPGTSQTLGDVAELAQRRGMVGLGAEKVPVSRSVAGLLEDLETEHPRLQAVARSVNPFAPSKNPLIQAAANRFGRRIEEQHRLEAMIGGLKRGMSPDEAQHLADQLLFNPYRTGEALQAISPVLPFVRWWGKNIPLQLRFAMEHPNRVYALTHRLPEISRRVALSTPEVEESRRRPLGRYFAGQPLYWTGRKDYLGEPIVLPYPFSTETELYDVADAAGSLIRDVANRRPDIPLTRQSAWESLMLRANPLVQYMGEPNRDILRAQDIAQPITDPNAIISGYQSRGVPAGPFAELLHRTAERLGIVKPGETFPVLGTERAPGYSGEGAAYVMQEAARKRYMEQFPLFSAFPLALARLVSQNPTLEPAERIPSMLGAGLQTVPWFQGELNRAYQTQEQIKAQRSSARRARRE